MIHPWTAFTASDGLHHDVRTLPVGTEILGQASNRAKMARVTDIQTACHNKHITITTHSGKKLTCTPCQKVSVATEKSKVWREARTVKPGQRLVCEASGSVIKDPILSVTRNETARPTYFVGLVTKLGNAFCGGVLCACR